jgi:hypothetical protein
VVERLARGSFVIMTLIKTAEPRLGTSQASLAPIPSAPMAQRTMAAAIGGMTQCASAELGSAGPGTVHLLWVPREDGGGAAAGRGGGYFSLAVRLHTNSGAVTTGLRRQQSDAARRAGVLPE